jgi:hypothetical protein
LKQGPLVPLLLLLLLLAGGMHQAPGLAQVPLPLGIPLGRAQGARPQQQQVGVHLQGLHTPRVGWHQVWRVPQHQGRVAQHLGRVAQHPGRVLHTLGVPPVAQGHQGVPALGGTACLGVASAPAAAAAVAGVPGQGRVHQQQGVEHQGHLRRVGVPLGECQLGGRPQAPHVAAGRRTGTAVLRPAVLHQAVRGQGPGLGTLPQSRCGCV